ncbi:MAG: HAD family hydrolase [Planctomycetota bacterium]|nr:HAD family hydrolase [Planctomycetota bacterium]
MAGDRIPCEAVLFDLDNTLYEYAPCNEVGLLAAEQVLAGRFSLGEGRFRELHDQVRVELAEELRGSAASHERSLFFKRIAERASASEGRGSQPALAVHMVEAYWGAFIKRMEPAPYAHEQLSLLAGTHRLALVSNHTNLAQLKKVEALGFAPYFEAIITSEEAGVEKPHARIFELALQALGVSSDRAVMVGDDFKADYQGARSAGLEALLYTGFAASPQAHAEVASVASLDELGTRLTRLE